AFLSGSYARGTADAYSDVDLGLVTTEAAYEDFLATREAFIRRLGEPLLLEDFGTPETVHFILADGTEGELAVGRERHFVQVARGATQVLLDPQGLLAGVTFVGHHPTPDEQRETLRRLLVWFWH